MGKCLLAFVAMAMSFLVQGAEVEAVPGKQQFWAISASGNKSFYRAEANHELIGFGSQLSLSYGWMKPNYFVLYGVDYSLGPYSVKREGLLIDYQGLGLSAIMGSPAEGDLMRNPEGAYGFLFGAAYLDTSGRSIGYDDLSTQPPAAPYEIPSRYRVHITDVSVVVGLFYSLLSAERPDLKVPDSLKTRVEGSILSLSAYLPLQSGYVAKSEYINERGETVEKSSDGRLQGFKLVLGLHIIIGH